MPTLFKRNKRLRSILKAIEDINEKLTFIKMVYERYTDQGFAVQESYDENKYAQAQEEKGLRKAVEEALTAYNNDERE